MDRWSAATLVHSDCIVQSNESFKFILQNLQFDVNLVNVKNIWREKRCANIWSKYKKRVRQSLSQEKKEKGD